MNPTALSFTAAGPAYAQTVAVTQPNNVGGYSVSGCGGVTTQPSTTTGSLVVTPTVAGVCTITVTGSAGSSATISVTVTTTVITQQ